MSSLFEECPSSSCVVSTLTPSILSSSLSVEFKILKFSTFRNSLIMFQVLGLHCGLPCMFPLQHRKENPFICFNSIKFKKKNPLAIVS